MARTKEEIIGEMVDSGLFSDDEIRKAALGQQQPIGTQQPEPPPPSKMAYRVMKYVRPTLEIGGAMGGSVLAGGASAPTIAGVIPGAIAGGALGYGAGKSAADYLDRFVGIKEPIRTAQQAITETVGNVGEGVGQEATGLVMQPLASGAWKLAKWGTKRAISTFFGPKVDDIAMRYRRSAELKTAKPLETLANELPGDLENLSKTIGSESDAALSNLSKEKFVFEGGKTPPVGKGVKIPTAEEGGAKGGEIELKAFRYGKDNGDVTFSSKNKDYSEEYATVKGGKPEDVKEVTVKAQNPITIELSQKEFSDPSVENKYIAQAKKNGNDLVIFQDKVNGDEFYAKIKLTPKESVAQSPLHAEALKYGTPEEFVSPVKKSLGDAQTGKQISVDVYHGTPDFRFSEEFDPTKKGYYKNAPDELPYNAVFESAYGKVKSGFKSKSRTGNIGVSFTDDYSVAKSYADKPAFDNQNSIPSVLKRRVILKNPFVVDFAGKEWKLGSKKIDVKKIQEQGYDGIILKNIKDNYHPSTTKKPSNNIIVFDTNSIASKSQLAAVWDEAHSATKAMGGEADFGIKEKLLETVEKARDGIGSVSGASVGAKKVLTDYLGRIKKLPANISEADLGKIIRDIDNDIDWMAKEKAPLNDALETVRKNIDGMLKVSNPGYKEAMVPVAENVRLLKKAKNIFKIRREIGEGLVPTDTTSTALKRATDETRLESRDVLDAIKKITGRDYLRESENAVLNQKFTGGRAQGTRNTALMGVIGSGLGGGLGMFGGGFSGGTMGAVGGALAGGYIDREGHVIAGKIIDMLAKLPAEQAKKLLASPDFRRMVSSAIMGARKND